MANLSATRAAELNAQASFFPVEHGEDGEHPMMEIAGVQVYAYFDEDGILCVSVHTDLSPDQPEEWAADPVPLAFRVNGKVIADLD